MGDGRIRVAIIIADGLATSTASVSTAMNLIQHLDRSRYAISIVHINSFVPRCLAASARLMREDPAYRPLSELSRSLPDVGIFDLSALSLGELRSLFDVAIISIYNTFGEDGRLIGLLETIGLPYVSPSLATSALCFDKALTKRVLRGAGIKVPNDIEIFAPDCQRARNRLKIERQIEYPVVVKPCRAGASRGVGLVRRLSQLWPAVRAASKFSNDILIEEFIAGTEYSIGVIGHYSSPTVLPPVLIRTRREFFDYAAKYVPGEAEEICPAPLTPQLQKRIKDVVRRCYKAVKAHSHSRIDLIVAEDDSVVTLEVNTFPGLTPASIFPKELRAAGTSLSEFLDGAVGSQCGLS
jgi:D-alanine-D-alanine ligase